MSNEPLSEWHGVSTDEQGRVEELRLSSNGLTGTIGAELGVLTRLTGLYLNDNELTGTIPPELENLTQLQAFDIRNTGLCVAADSELHTWIATIQDFQGTATCSLVLDFAHFANGEAIVSDLVLINAGTAPTRPVLSFYDQAGTPIAVESVMEVLGDLVVREDGALSVQTELEPLGELTISTHGRGDLVRGSVKVVSDGPVGGVLRFDLPGVGVAGVGASSPVRDAIFPARRQAGGISTAAALHNPGEEEMGVMCRLMSGGVVLEEVEIPLEANGQDARFIEEVFTRTDTSDFVGSVRCTAPGEGMFTGLAVELDAANRIFTTLPVVPVDSMDAQDQEGVLDFAHFANGGAIVSDLVFINAGTAPTRPALYFYDKAGAPIAAESVVDVTGDLEVTEDGALTVRTELEPLRELTISTHGRGVVVSGSVKVVSDGPIGGVLRFDLSGIGVAGVGASSPVRDAIFPARRQAGGNQHCGGPPQPGRGSDKGDVSIDERGRCARRGGDPSGGQRAGGPVHRRGVQPHRYLKLRRVGAAAPRQGKGRSLEWPWNSTPPTASSRPCRWCRFQRGLLRNSLPCPKRLVLRHAFGEGVPQDSLADTSPVGPHRISPRRQRAADELPAHVSTPSVPPIPSRPLIPGRNPECPRPHSTVPMRPWNRAGDTPVR